MKWVRCFDFFFNYCEGSFVVVICCFHCPTECKLVGIHIMHYSWYDFTKPGSHTALKKVSAANPSHQSSGHPARSGGRSRRDREDRGHRENRPSITSEQSPYEFTETEEAVTGPTQVLCLHTRVFSASCGALECVNE